MPPSQSNSTAFHHPGVIITKGILKDILFEGSLCDKCSFQDQQHQLYSHYSQFDHHHHWNQHKRFKADPVSDKVSQDTLYICKIVEINNYFRNILAQKLMSSLLRKI